MTETPVLVGWPSGHGIQYAFWRSERGAPPPSRVVLADDTLSADTAYRLACQGTGLLWQGDFNNARLLLQALGRRADRPLRRQSAARKAASQAANRAAEEVPALPAPEPSSTATPPPASGPEPDPALSDAAAAFYRYRQAKGQRAQVLSMLLIPLQADYSMALRRAPNLRLACLQAWGPADSDELPPGVSAAGPHSVASLRELLGIVGAFEWRKKGVPLAALGQAPEDRIHPHYGVFSPVRGEYVDLVAHTPLPAAVAAGGPVFDIGTGTGVLAAVLARRSAALQVTATDNDARALACAQDNLQRLQLQQQVQVLQADLFPPGLAALVVCNPPWLPLRPGSPLERAVYDDDSRMLKGFLNGLPTHLLPGGEGWLILSDLAEILGLRTRQQLLGWVAAAGLQVLGRVDTRPSHRKVADTTDLLHAARAAEVTSLWRLGLA